MYDFTLARCDVIIVMRFVISKIYLLGCSNLHHASLISRASIHSEIHGEERNFLHLPNPLPSPSKVQKHEKGLPIAIVGGIGKHRFHCEDASDVFRPYYTGEILKCNNHQPFWICV